MDNLLRPGSNDAGETLIELIIAVAIMGITVVAIVGGVGTTILMSDVHRKEATAGAYVRSYAEAVTGHYSTSAVSSSYLPGAVGFVAPTGFTVVPPPVKCWNGTVFSTGCANTDVQQVTLNLTSSDLRASESLVVIVRKP